MIHIVFQQADIAALEKSFDLDESIRGATIQIKDDYAVGPLQDIYTTEGIDARKRWWREVLAGGDYAGLADNGSVDDRKTVEDLKATLLDNPSERLWIWAAQNKHDVSGYYWLVSQLKEYQGRCFILYLNNLPFINEKGHIFYPVNLYQIAPREFVKAKKLARLITPGEFEVDSEEWEKFCRETDGIRLLEGGKKLMQKDHAFYDEELLKFISTDWVRVHKLIGTYLGKSTHATGDAYLLWRIKKLVATGRLDMQGVNRNMKDFEVKTPVAQIVATS